MFFFQMAASDTVLKILGFNSRSSWLMCPAERLAVIGLLEVIRPKLALELGHAYGGCTEWLARYSDCVYSVDHSSAVVESCKRWSNVHPMHLKTSEALSVFLTRGLRFDLAIVDADHSYGAAKSDLEGTMKLADIIVLHDTFNPDCRAGYLAALENSGMFADLDFLQGGYQVDGAWGGIGIVLTRIPGSFIRSVTPRLYPGGAARRAS